MKLQSEAEKQKQNKKILRVWKLEKKLSIPLSRKICEEIKKMKLKEKFHYNGDDDDDDDDHDWLTAT